jgi:prepilin-type N-terminal cleavage/methylation domain-containing protein
MRMPKRGEKGFTLIELLIVVAILGVLAAVVIPNVGRFIGAGEEEAQATEFTTIQSAVVSMMVDNKLDELPTPVDGSSGRERTNDMSKFPDISPIGAGGKYTGPTGNGTIDYYQSGGDEPGYVLYQHDIWADGKKENLVNYVVTCNTTYYYTVDKYGILTSQTEVP